MVVRTIFSDLDWLGHDEDFTPTPAREPTLARPGSPEKLEVLRRRVARGEALFHPDDEPIPLPPRETSEGYQPGIREMRSPV